MASYAWHAAFAFAGKVVAVSVAALAIGEELELRQDIIDFGAKLAEGNGSLIHLWGVGLVLLSPAVTFILLAAAVAAIARFTKPGAVCGLYFSGAIMWLLCAIDLITYSWLWTTSDYTRYAPAAAPLFLSAVYSVGGLLCMIFLVAPQCSFFRSVVEPRMRMMAAREISVRRHPDATSEVVSRLQATTDFSAGHAIPVLFHPQDGWAAVYPANGAPGWIAMSSPVFFVHPVTLTKRVELFDTSPASKHSQGLRP